MSWTDDRVDLLKKLWGEGLSASQIAGRLGGVTRNAVIGKVHRLGLSGRATTTRMKSTRPRRSSASIKRIGKPRFAQTGNPALRSLYSGDCDSFFMPAEDIEIPLHERRSLQDLTESSCRWPIGDPQNADFHFCNGEKVPGLPYCEHHCRRAFQPPQTKRRNRTSTQGGVTPMQVSAPEQDPETSETVDA
ncbi:MAG: GcrA family cell cycle regulator [Hyphomicrobiaceae bacterium]